MDPDSELQEAVNALVTAVDNYASGGTHTGLLLASDFFLDAALCFIRTCLSDAPPSIQKREQLFST